MAKTFNSAKKLDEIMAECCSGGCYTARDCLCLGKSLSPDHWGPSKHPRQLSLCVCPVLNLFCRHLQILDVRDKVAAKGTSRLSQAGHSRKAEGDDFSSLF